MTRTLRPLTVTNARSNLRDVIVVGTYRDAIHLRTTGTVPDETVVESVASIVAGNIRGLRVDRIVIAPSALRVTDFPAAISIVRMEKVNAYRRNMTRGVDRPNVNQEFCPLCGALLYGDDEKHFAAMHPNYHHDR